MINNTINNNTINNIINDNNQTSVILILIGFIMLLTTIIFLCNYYIKYNTNIQDIENINNKLTKENEINIIIFIFFLSLTLIIGGLIKNWQIFLYYKKYLKMSIISNYSLGNNTNSNYTLDSDDNNHQGIPSYVPIIIGTIILFRALISSCNYFIEYEKYIDDDKKSDNKKAKIFILFCVGFIFLLGEILS